MKQFTSRKELRSYLDKEQDICLGFVPTMGALHEGHISLVELSKAQCQRTIVSIFVNPTQFNDKDDLKNYPRTLERDLALLETAGVDYIFIPSVEEIYQKEDTRVFDFGAKESVMEGATRPGHFNGVAQVVSLLFDIVKPTKAFFGEKDFQQIAIIRAMVNMLSINVEIIDCPIKRAENGLALSSRNALLTPEHFAAAPTIYKALKKAVELKDTLSPKQIKEQVTEMINNTGLLSVIYFNIIDAYSLQEITSWSETVRPHGCIAVKAGNIRLIDNISFVCK
ncbi:MAG: pantoate--beta-alanine ligase [Rikenellaceae bacterium]